MIIEILIAVVFSFIFGIVFGLCLWTKLSLGNRFATRLWIKIAPEYEF